jgi:geranylgeranyl diphosphate synthase type II
MTETEISLVVSRYLDELRQTVDAALDTVTQFDADCPNQLREAVRYSLLSSGKRLRPVLVLAACELCGGKRDDAVPAACAVEMIHTYSLIHDDLPAMDNDDLRRGQPTCHKKFGEATAILAGDALLAFAFEMIGSLTSPELAGKCCKELAVASGACRLVGGQMDDILHEKNYASNSQNKNKIETPETETPKIETPETKIREIERIHHRKTGALIRVSLQLGCFVAGATETKLAALDEFGIHFGLAFQITDDLLDVLGDEQTAGKRLRKDADMDKWSYPRFLGIDGAQREAEKSVRQAQNALKLFPAETPPLETLQYLVQNLLVRKK